MSAFIWIDATRKDAIRWAAELAGDCKAGDALRELLDEVKQLEEMLERNNHE